jgi:hypothetical protein
MSTLKVVSNDGQTLRGTLLTLGSHGNQNLYVTPPTDPQNRLIADGDALTPVAVQLGDRLVLELGTEPSDEPLLSDFVCMYVGDSHAGDLALDETSTADLDPWIQFSNDILFSGQEVTAAAVLTGTATLAPAASATRAGSAALTGTATLSVAGSAVRAASASLIGVATLTASGTIAGGRTGSDVHLEDQLGDVHLAEQIGGDVVREDRLGDVLITEPLGDIIRVDVLDRDAARPDPI